MPGATITYRPCPRCGQAISSLCRAKYCSDCQYKFLGWKDKNRWVLRFKEDDICFFFEHLEGCTKSKAASYLEIPVATISVFQGGEDDALDLRGMVLCVHVIRSLGKRPDVWLPTDIAFVRKRLKGCLDEELRLYLEICQTAFRQYRRRGKVQIERQWRESGSNGATCRQVSFHEMIRIINLKHNWLSVYEVAREKGVSYKALLHYAQDGYFGTLGQNLEGSLAIHRSILGSFEARWQKARAVHEEERRQGLRRLLAEDEVNLTIIHEWLGTSAEGALWLYADRGWLKGKPKHGMFVVKVADLKVFLLKVAAGRYPVQRRLLGDWNHSPLGEDSRFVGKICRLLLEEVPPERQPYGNRFAQPGRGKLTKTDVMEIFSSSEDAVYWWFANKTIASTMVDGIFVTTVFDVKELILKILQRKCRIAKSAAETALTHPLVAQDQEFAKEVKRWL